ncbi:MAG TPA: MFS transporter [Streptosporangiaceae bacterium]|nr:MFS transporter [Streptosporangiaceae bacterium]
METRLTARRRLAIVLALCLSAFLISVDVTIVNVALPTLVRSLGASTTQLQWVVDAYSLVFAALVLTAGSLSDRLGRKGVLLTGLGVFTGGSLAGALVGTTSELIGARAVMGLGAALMFPATLSLLVNVFTERGERAKAIGLWGATTGVGIATGPIVGGWLLERFWWGSIFAFMAVAATVIAVVVARAVPTSRDLRTPPADWRGFVVSSAAMAVLILGVIESPDWGWASAAAVSTMTGGVALLVLFVLLERRTRHPMLDVRLFRNPRFTAASGSVAVSLFALQGFIFLITQYFQFIKAFSPLGTGVRLLPVAAAVAVASVLGTKLAVRVGNKMIVTSGLVLFAAGTLWTATFPVSASYSMIAVQMVILGTGMGLTSAPATEAIMGAVPKAKAGAGSAVNDATRLFGGTLGVAVIGSVAASLYSSRLASTAPAHLPAQAASAAKESVGAAFAASRALTQPGFTQAGHALADSATGAFMHSLHGGCVVAGGVVIAGAIMAGLFLPARPGRESEAPSPAGEPDPITLLGSKP